MPTLVWVRRRPESGTGATSAGGGSGTWSSASVSAPVPDSVASAVPAVPAGPVQAALPAVADGRKRTKRKKSHAKEAKKTSKTTSERDLLPRGGSKLPSGTFGSWIRWGGKVRYIGTFATPKQAFAVYVSVRKDLNNGAAFNAARKKAVEAVGGEIGKRKKRKTNCPEPAAKKRSKATSEREIPEGVYKTTYGNFQFMIRSDGNNHYIGFFDTPDQASAAFMSVRKALDGATSSLGGAKEVNSIFDAAKKKAVEAVGGIVPEKRTHPRGVTKVATGKIVSQISWDDRTRYIGTFDTPEQASAAHTLVRKDLDNAKLLDLGADKVDATFTAARKKAVEAVGGSNARKKSAKATSDRDLPTAVKKKSKTRSERDLPRGVYKTRSGKFVSQITCCGKTNRYIGVFDTSEQASAAYLSVSEDLSKISLPGLGADEADAIFDAARKKAVEAVDGIRKRKKRKLNVAKAAPSAKKKSKATPKRDLPKGVSKTSSGNFQARIRWDGEQRYIGTFNTSEQASAAFLSVKKALWRRYFKKEAKKKALERGSQWED